MLARPVPDPRPRDRDVVGFALDPEEPGALEHGGGAGAAAAGERVEHESAWWGEEPHEPAHQLDRLDRRVDVRDGLALHSLLVAWRRS